MTIVTLVSGCGSAPWQSRSSLAGSHAHYGSTSSEASSHSIHTSRFLTRWSQHRQLGASGPACTVQRVADVEPGLYELLITNELRAKLDGLSTTLVARGRCLSGADAADRISWHVSKQVGRALLDVNEEDRADVALRVARALLDRLGEVAEADDGAQLVEPAVLPAVLRRRQDGEPDEIDAPVIPLLDTTLLTNAPGEPTLWSQLGSEIASSNLTRSATVTGLAWNVRLAAARNPDVIAKFEAVFESYWSSGDVVPYDADQFDAEQQRTARRSSTRASRPSATRSARRSSARSGSASLVPGTSSTSSPRSRASTRTTWPPSIPSTPTS